MVVGKDAEKLSAGFHQAGRGHEWLAKIGSIVRQDQAHTDFFAQAYKLDLSSAFKSVVGPKL